MRRALVLLVLIILIAALLSAAGCGSKEEEVVEPPTGDVSERDDGVEITYETEEGDVTHDISERPPTEEELGVPVYPGADLVPGTAGVMTSSGPEGELISAGAEFRTRDAYAEVASFYTGKLGAPAYEDPPMDSATWMAESGDGSFTVVTVRAENGGSLISIGRIARDL